VTIQTHQPDDSSSSPTVLDREIVFRGTIFDVDDVGARLHDGRVTRRQVVTKADGAIAIPITDCGTLVMVRQHRAGLLDSPAYPDCEVYEFPAGHVDPGEEPAAAAERNCSRRPATRPPDSSLPAPPLRRPATSRSSATASSV